MVTRMPQSYVGVWRRRSIEYPDGAVDRTTAVYWLQTHALFADIRVPQPRPTFNGARSLDAMSVAQLHWLAGQQGFAGVLESNGERCTWHRHIDFQPQSAAPDSGRMHWRDDLLIEEGIHTAYREEWEPLETDSRAVVALRLIDEVSNGVVQRARRGVWVVVGNYFMCVVDRLRALPSQRADTLQQLVTNPKTTADEALGSLDCEISFGVRRGGAHPWEIRLSTLPFREGSALLEPDAPPITAERGLYLQTVPGHGGTLTRRWAVAEFSPDFRW